MSKNRIHDDFCRNVQGPKYPLNGVDFDERSKELLVNSYLGKLDPWSTRYLNAVP